MISDKDMEDYARECVRLAHVTSDPQIREQLFEMAREWMAAAMREGRRPCGKERVRIELVVPPTE